MNIEEVALFVGIVAHGSSQSSSATETDSTISKGLTLEHIIDENE